QGVVIEQVPLALEFANGVVSRPADHRFENLSLIRERPVRIVADRVAEEVRVTRGIREVVLATVLVHPRRFEEATRVIPGAQRLAVLVEDHHFTRRLGELLHVWGLPRNAGPERRLIVCWLFIALVVHVVTVL